MSIDDTTGVGGARLLTRRATAYLLDILILFAVLAPLGQGILWLLKTTPRTGPAIAGTILWNFSLPAWLYFILGDGSGSGATLGKRLLALQVRSDAGKRLSKRNAVVRTGRQAPALGAGARVCLCAARTRVCTTARWSAGES